MAAYRYRVYRTRVIVMCLHGSLQGQSLWCKGNCKEFYGSLLGQVLWCKGNCKESEWQLTESEFMMQE